MLDPAYQSEDAEDASRSKELLSTTAWRLKSAGCLTMPKLAACYLCYSTLAKHVADKLC